MTVFLGLTGSIGMGKSTTAGMFRAAGCPVYDADAAVHAVYAAEGAAPVEARFPGVTMAGAVDRARLSARVLGQPDELAALERIVHPLVRAREESFRAAVRASARRVAVLDIPLLFETGAEGRCDAVVVVSASGEDQRARVLSRPGMTEERLQAILARQTPDVDKRRRAHFLVDTGRGVDFARAEVAAILRAVAGMSPAEQIRA